MPERKIVQITSGGDTGFYALCDDGTVWMWEWATLDSEAGWQMIDPIPQWSPEKD